ncbi:osmoprotectant transport system permease protein [Jatrophihabitans endophyticus]|uniref:Osmoprotectant transport system permease protein n=1 Tax=Jatrophihabitans endophyticus TaxID=1206085 RepID=A0A1M5CGM2_9ACTN|nr:ABC transporter permease [Jatrophihabitans endophyticus]SHF53532.1 osmoprotectant transport system permease protein [Jatrophihabitans endophyticus]
MSNDFIDGFTFVKDQWSSVLYDVTVQHLVLSAKSIAIAIVIGLPVGALLGHIHRFSFLAINTSNLARALPSLAVLAILLPYTGIGDTTIIIALVVLAAPPILTNSYVAIDGVDPDTVDAARGIGLRGMQVLFKVELPLALPLIFAGIRTSSVFVIATATLKGFFGSGGLGNVIGDPASYKLSGVIGASYVLIAMAVLVQIAFLGVEYLVTPAGLRRRSLSLTRGGSRTSAAITAGADNTDAASESADDPDLDNTHPAQGSFTR